MNFTRKFRGKLKRREGGVIRSKYITLMYEIIKKLKLKIFLYPHKCSSHTSSSNLLFATDRDNH